MLLMDPYLYLLGWSVSACTPDGCHRLSYRLLEVELYALNGSISLLVGIRCMCVHS